MNVYIFRHAMADFGKKPHKDDPPLSKEGITDAHVVVKLATDNLGFRPNVIASSPLLRAKQTAEIASEDVGLKEGFTVDECLYGDRDPVEVIAFLAKLDKTDNVVLVSHMPLVSELLREMIGGRAEIEQRNGSIACIGFKGKAAKGKGTLVWLVQPIH
jgi:phosphohistidine phosphatase